MHKYFIEIFRYTEAGALEPHHFATFKADDELQVQNIRDKYEYELQTVTRGDEEIRIKAYKVVLHKLAYVKVANIDAEINGIFMD